MAQSVYFTAIPWYHLVNQWIFREMNRAMITGGHYSGQRTVCLVCWFHQNRAMPCYCDLHQQRGLDILMSDLVIF